MLGTMGGWLRELLEGKRRQYILGKEKTDRLVDRLEMEKTESERYRNLRVLRWATIILPFLFLNGINYVYHFHLVESLSVPAALSFGVLSVLLAVGVWLFSSFVFTLLRRAEERAIGRRRELIVLNTVATAASQPMKLEVVLRLALDGVIEAVGVDGGVACVLDEKNKELLHVAYNGIPDALLGPLQKVKLDQDVIASTVVRTGEPVVIKDISLDPRIVEAQKAAGFCSAISVPLKSEGVVKGVMALVSRTRFTFEPSKIQFLVTVGGQMAMAIERNQLQQQIVSTAVLEERERIAREMHDGLAQVLGYINAKTSAISRLLKDGGIEEARVEIAGLREASREVYGDVRESIFGLRLASTRGGTLMGNLTEYAEHFADMSGITVEVDGLDDSIALDKAVEIQVMRIVQEALTNVRKHAHAKRVDLSATMEAGRLRLTLKDDGIGFDQERVAGNKTNHFGIQTMRERAADSGGEFKMESRPGSGTKVSVSVPLRDTVGAN